MRGREEPENLGSLHEHQSPSAPAVSPTSLPRVRPHERHVAAKYVFVDVVGFSRKGVQAQVEVVATLNKIVREVMEASDVPREQQLLLPTGDGVCIALQNVIAPAAHVEIALAVLAALAKHNAVAPPTRAFQLRIGVNGGTDTRITDVNDRENLAGTGINLAQRLMSMADPNQVMVGRSVFSDLAQNEDYRDWFQEHDAIVKHEERHTIYQLVAKERPYLDTKPSTRAGAGVANDLFRRVTSDEFLRGLTVRQLEELDRAVLRAHVVSAGASDVESYLRAFERARGLPAVWRKDYHLDINIDNDPRGVRRARLAWDWTYVNHSGEDITDFQQHFVHIARHLPDNVGDDWFQFVSASVDEEDVLPLVTGAKSRRPDGERLFEGHLPLSLPASASRQRRQRRLRYVWRVLERHSEPLVVSVFTPISSVRLSLRCPCEIGPRLYVMGLPDLDQPTDPVPFHYEDEGPYCRYSWHFRGWLVEHQGFILVLGAPDQESAARKRSSDGDLGGGQAGG